MTTETVYAPMAGIVRVLTDVPDVVFAQNMAGIGLAIDPLDELVRAPFDGRITAIAPTGHAITLESRSGIQLLIHIGIDTVTLNGAGFTIEAVVGDEVRMGDPLIRFDIDTICGDARSAVTPIVCGARGARLTHLATGRIEAGAALFTITLDAGAEDVDARPLTTAHLVARVGLIHGLHARPSARLAALVRARNIRVTLVKGDIEADAASVASLLALGIVYGDQVMCRAVGEHPRQALSAIADLLAGEADEANAVSAPLPPLAQAEIHADEIAGVSAAPGVGVGPAFFLAVDAICDDNDIIASPTQSPVQSPLQSPGVELARLEAAIADLRQSLMAAGPGTTAGREIATAHLALIDDPALLAEAAVLIASQATAGAAWRTVSRAREASLAASPSARVRERAIDLRDIERRLIARLAGRGDVGMPPQGSVVIADDIVPSLLLRLAPGHLAGICTARGGATAHAAILAAAAGVPMIVAAGPGVMGVAPGTIVIVDADRSAFNPAPDATAILAARVRREAAAVRAAAAQAAAYAPCRLIDGTRIEVFANLGGIDDAHRASAAGAEGCGLLRTEFLFAERATVPDEDQQAEIYAGIAAAMGDRPLIFRLLDAGGDKPLACLPFAAEDNPALGLRGIRFLLARPHLLRAQLRAMLRSVAPDRLRIMLPMVVEPAEVLAVRAMLDQARDALGITARVQLGVMVETPAAVAMAADLGAVADFLSVGSNDLAQYVLAMDRGNSALAARVDALHPAVLRMIKMAADGARVHGRWFGICGGIASDPAVAALLVGLGCVELSATPAAVPAIKAALRLVDGASARALATAALRLTDAAAVRELLADHAPTGRG